MIDFNNIPNIYFLGIGGIGMSALARFAKAQGKNVAGYDLTATPLTRALESEGIQIHYTDDINQLPNTYQSINSLVVRTPAVPESLNELKWLSDRGYHIVKRSELLGFLTTGHYCVAVAGTHGKTSVSTMIAHLLHQSDVEVGAFLGGISRNFQSNLVLPSSSNSIVVTEADEFDRSFLQLSPSLAVVTSVEPDHLDIYGNFDAVKEAFAGFVEKTRTDGKVLFHKRVNIMHHLSRDVDALFYSIDDEADFCLKNLRIEQGAYVFDFYAPFMVIHDVRMNYPGRVNLENMVGAMAAAIIAGADPMKVRDAVATYKGVARRFDIRFKNEKITYIDDYAHHPGELSATIKSVRELYPGKKVLGVFQPHLYSRTKDFAEGFARSLDMLDELILLEIYPAREKPLLGINSSIILNKMKIERKSLAMVKDVVGLLSWKEFDVLLTMGAGNIDMVVGDIEEMLTLKYSK
ncbi:MAG: UDP-N-acetylmuramate--L-alanine ligase [Prolixibacteraceae bacterium]|nr:UDP-N-acetylmuramate--L-alanine ligase [Prolixibacteraceae bacterium]MBN2648890.1 UDP-N-acetylmuramate--L-alanine ligase [Prolixibacteraceae bacterium]